MTRNENDVPRRTKAAKPRPATAGNDAATTGDTPKVIARQRIAKLMARVGLCSRRDAEAWIVDGRVTVNGEVLTSPATDVGPDDTILVDGRPMPAAEKTRLFMFHKPRGLVTSDHDPEGRPTVMDYLREHWPEGSRVVTIGRLDINTEGLLLLTNDGGLARELELPRTGWVRRYRVRAKGETDQGVLDGLRDGVSIDGVDYAGVEAKLDRSQGANCWLTVGLREGKNREVKRLLEHIGLEVNRLIRLSFGPFQLLDLPEGRVEEVKTRVLRDQLGENLAAAAGVDFDDPVTPAEPATKPAERREPKGFRGGSEPAGRRPDGGPTKDRSERPPRGRAGGEEPRRRGPDARRQQEAPVRRERPAAGVRKHVSTLRADEAGSSREGPRKRIERSDTKDRRNRTVTVERLVPSRPAAPEPTRSRRGAGRFIPREAEDRGRSPPRGGVSPSAMAKRERVSRSGVVPPEERRRWTPPRPGAKRDASRAEGRPARKRDHEAGDRRDAGHKRPAQSGDRPPSRTEGPKRYGKASPDRGSRGQPTRGKPPGPSKATDARRGNSSASTRKPQNIKPPKATEQRNGAGQPPRSRTTGPKGAPRGRQGQSPKAPRGGPREPRR